MLRNLSRQPIVISIVASLLLVPVYSRAQEPLVLEPGSGSERVVDRTPDEVDPQIDRPAGDKDELILQLTNELLIANYLLDQHDKHIAKIDPVSERSGWLYLAAISGGVIGGMILSAIVFAVIGGRK